MSLDLENLLDSYIHEFYVGLHHPVATHALSLYETGEHLALTKLAFDPSLYDNVEDARSALAAIKFLSKADFLSTNVDLEAVAIGKFKAAEEVCHQTNRNIFHSWFKNPMSAGVLLSMRRKIERILGKIDADELIDSCNWGPGATTKLASREVSIPKKFDSENLISVEAYNFVKPWFHLAYPHWDLTFEINGNSEVITVPKDAKSDRTIAIEPGINLWFQKGIGSVIRRRLRNEGIDLNDQRINQAKARLGSKFNNLATVDFSSASDTIAYELVREALPCEWFRLLNVFRSSTGQYKEEIIEFKKFSSMGNGFTFELETLLFYTMATACCDVLGICSDEVSVYGDDVILPSTAYELYASVSADLGFTVNLSKSYSDGPYRESCGEHYWNGISIKPIFQKESFDGKSSVILAANNVRRLARSRRSGGCDSNLRDCYQLLTNYLGTDCPRISEGYGDVGLIENIDDSPGVERAVQDSTDETKPNGWEGFFVRVWAVTAAQIELSSPGVFLTRVKTIGSLCPSLLSMRSGVPLESIARNLHDIHALAYGNKIPLPGRVKYAKSRMFIPRWDDVGPWV